MADLEYKVRADAGAAISSLSKLRRTVEEVSGSFSTLTGVIAAIGLTAVIQRTVAYADAIQDLSDATGIAISNITGFNSAITLNGGSAEFANKAILKLVTSIDAAAGGSVAALKAFGDLGISFQDLNRLSEQDILAKTIQGLANISNASERAGKAQQLLGREARAINWDGVAISLGRATEEARKHQAAIASASAAQNSLDVATIKLQTSILQAIKPLADFVANLKPDQIDKFVQATIQIGTALTALAGSLVVLNALAAAFAALGTYLALAKTGFATLAGAAASFAVIGSMLKDVALVLGSAFVTAGAKLAVLKDIFGIVGRAVLALITGLLRILPATAAIATALYALHAILKNVFDIDVVKKFGDAYDWLVNKIKGIKPPEMPEADLSKLREEIAGENQRLQNRVNANKEMNRMAGLEKEIAGEIAKTNLAARQRLDNLKKESSDKLKALALEESLLSLNDRQAAAARARADEEKRLGDQLRSVTQQIASTQLEIKLIDPSDVKALNLAKARLGELKSEQALLNDLLVKAPGEIEKAVAQLEQARLKRQAERDLLIQQIELQEEYEQGMANLQRLQQEAFNNANNIVNKLKEENAATEQREQLERSIRNMRGQDQDNIRKIFDLEQDRKKLLEDIANMPNITGEDRVFQEQRVNAEIDRRRKLIEEGIAQSGIEQSSFLNGWTEAFDKWRNNLKTNAELAADSFNTLTRGFEDAIVKFVQTGKLSFKDLFNNLIAEAVRASANKLLMSILGGVFGGGGGGGNWLSAIFGGFRAAGGPVSPNKAYVVGEQGPELFMPKNAGSIIPNGSTVIGSSQPSVTNVTYQIQAVDAASFRSLVARDPEFLFAVTEQGRRSLPVRNRR